MEYDYEYSGVKNIIYHIEKQPKIVSSSSPREEIDLCNVSDLFCDEDMKFSGEQDVDGDSFLDHSVFHSSPDELPNNDEKENAEPTELLSLPHVNQAHTPVAEITDIFSQEQRYRQRQISMNSDSFFQVISDFIKNDSKLYEQVLTFMVICSLVSFTVSLFVLSSFSCWLSKCFDVASIVYLVVLQSVEQSSSLSVCLSVCF